MVALQTHGPKSFKRDLMKSIDGRISKISGELPEEWLLWEWWMQKGMMRYGNVVGSASFWWEFQRSIIISVTDVLSLNACNYQSQVVMYKVLECIPYVIVSREHLNVRKYEIS